MNILNQLADYARFRSQEKQKTVSLDRLQQEVSLLPPGDFALGKALKKERISFICECKKASPSKGIIVEDFPYLDIAQAYEKAGADAISVLTEPKWFLGADSYLQEIAKNVNIPCLRKDFVIDEYMIYEAKLLGASAVLLICAILTPEEIQKYITLCDKLGISALVEAHNSEEVQQGIAAGARILGVNNRNLKDFTVDTDNTKRLREQIPPEVLMISESGISQRSQVAQLELLGVDGVLIGETLMLAPDKNKKLEELRGNR